MFNKLSNNTQVVRPCICGSLVWILKFEIFEILGPENLIFPIFQYRLGYSVVRVRVRPLSALIVSITSHAIVLYFQNNKTCHGVLFHFPCVLSDSQSRLKVKNGIGKKKQKHMVLVSIN